MSDYHPNTLRFLRLLGTIDWKRWRRNHPEEDFGQYVRRRSEEHDNVEGDYPSDEAMKIAERMARIYKKNYVDAGYYTD